jgi:hypothetical protein
MCQWLAGERRRLDELVHECLQNTRSRLGSVKAQERYFQRLRKAGGKGFAEVGLDAGKRAKFTMHWVEWEIAAPMTGRILESDEPVPERPWLSCTLTYFYGPGHRNRIDEDDNLRRYHVFSLTHHAMQRLAERCSAREPYHLLDALTELWRQVDAVSANDAVPKTKDWRVPLPATGGIAILERHPVLSFLVKTILEPGM